MTFVRWLLLVTLLACGQAVQAGQPYVPIDDSEVLETLPSDVFAQRDRVARLRERLAEEPDNVDLATAIARHYVSVGKSNGDPRCFGYARAAIRPWWDNPEGIAEVLKVRAELQEISHDYAAALQDLRKVLSRDPKDTQAWVEVANICRVTGDYEAASQASNRLGDSAESIPAMVAAVPLLAVTGEAEAAYELLTTSQPALQSEHAAVVPWALTMLGEIARALDQPEAAERHFREGLREAPGNSYLRRAYADFLLDSNQAEEALTLLGEDLSDNGLLLRSAIAAKRVGRSELAAERAEILRDRFTETRLRGDLPHGRYEARFELEFGEDKDWALQLARENWDRQKELRDTRNLLEAALAADHPAAADDAVAFLRKHRTQDASLNRLVDLLEAE